jgi:predicted TIM-barrel fold metal-dependent hydrolase
MAKQHQSSPKTKHPDQGTADYGSDWPLAPMKPYLEFVRRAIPAEHERRVFYENAKKVFRL